jgi:hypothetical protein
VFFFSNRLDSGNATELSPMDGIDGAILVRVHAWFPAIVPLDLLSSLL